MAKRRRKAAAEGEVPVDGEQSSSVNGAVGFRKASESWREERRAYKAIVAACASLKQSGVGDPDHLDKFVERVFRNAGVELQ